MRLTKPKLKPCPFCGGDAIYSVGGAEYSPHGFNAGCERGHAVSPDMDTAKEAAEWWNRRRRAGRAALKEMGE